MSGASFGRIEIEIDGDGPPVIFLHGLGATSSSFQPLLSALRGFRCIRPDFPGAGRSPRPYIPVTIDFLCETTLAIVKSIAWRASPCRGAFHGDVGGSASGCRSAGMGCDLDVVWADRRARGRGAGTVARSCGACTAERNDRHRRSSGDGRPLVILKGRQPDRGNVRPRKPLASGR